MEEFYSAHLIRSVSDVSLQLVLQFLIMSKPYCNDVQRTIQKYIKEDSRNLSRIIVQFTGYVITDWEYTKFRCQVMHSINVHMSNGFHGVDLIVGNLNHSFEYNETYALWLLNDLENLGYDCTPWFLTDEPYIDAPITAFMNVSWRLPTNMYGFSEPFEFELTEDDSSDYM